MKTLPPYKYDPYFNVNTLERDPRELNGSIHEEFLKNNPQIGPHEGRFLQLVLMGKKALCIHAEPYLADELKSYIDSGQLIFKEDTVPGRNKSYTICRAEYAHYIEEASIAIENIKNSRNNKDINTEIVNHRKLGTILGYPENEINFYTNKRRLEHIKEQQEKMKDSEIKPSLFSKIKNKLLG